MPPNYGNKRVLLTEEYNEPNSEPIITHVVFTDDTSVDGNSTSVKEEQQIVLTEIEVNFKLKLKI